jgi:hypothetical protein
MPAQKSHSVSVVTSDILTGGSFLEGFPKNVIVICKSGDCVAVIIRREEFTPLEGVSPRSRTKQESYYDYR